MNSNTATRFQAVANRSLFALFLLCLWLPTLDTFFELDRAPAPNEKRAPTKFPVFPDGWREVRGYVSGLESYFNDHFGCRKRLVRWNNLWRHDWFHEATHPDVMQGRAGWFYILGNRMIDHYHQGENFSAPDLQAWQKALETQRDRLGGRGVKFLFVVAPDKHSIYPEYLPEWMTKSPKPTKLDQFVEHMKAHSTVPVLDLRPALLAAKESAPVYLATDTHWNAYGAYIGYAEIINKLREPFPGLRPLPLESFEQRKFADHPGGDLAVFMGVETTVREKNFVELLPHPPLTWPKETALSDQRGINLPPRRQPFITENPGAQNKAIVLYDSFGLGIAKLVGCNFRQIIWVGHGDWPQELINREKPDIVIYEIVERAFNTQDPSELLNRENRK